MKNWIITFLLIFVTILFKAQCVTNVNLNTWSKRGPSSAGNWAVSSGGTSVSQSINGAPTFFVNPQDLINVEITGRFGVSAGAGDDDFIGFVVGYKEPSGTGSNYDFILFDWKKNINQNSPARTMLYDVNGNSTNTNFWAHTATAPGVFNLLQNSSTYPGWVHGVTYNFTCLYTSSRIVVKIENDTVADVSGCFEPGKFGFYNLSQGSVNYSNFSYRSVSDFSIINDSICIGNSIAQNEVDLDVFCYDNSVSNPYNTIRWEMGDGTVFNDSTEFSYSYTAAGNYNIELYTEDLGGCIDSITKTITVFDPNVSAGQDITICTNGTVPISATPTAVAPLSYSWSSGETTNAIAPSTSGQYIVEITDAAGCTNTDTMNLTIHEVPQASPSAVAVCLNEQTSMIDNSTIGTGSITGWQWDFGDGNNSSSQNPTHTYANDGTYTVQLTVTSDQNCTNAQSISYTVNELPVSNAGLDSLLNCSRTSIILDGSSSDNGANYSHQWSTSNGNILSGGTTLTPTVDLTGTYVITTTNTVTNCVTSDSLIITIDSIAPVSNAGLDTVITCIPNVNLDGTASSSGSNYGYLWSTVNGAINTGSTTIAPNVTAVGRYYLLVTDNNNGCTAIDSVNVGIDTLAPNANAGIDTLLTCSYPMINLMGENSSTGNQYTYSWATSDGNIVSGGTSQTPSVDAIGTYFITVLNTINNCSSIDSVTIGIDTIVPTSSAGVDSIVTCLIPEIVLNGNLSSSGNYSYMWTTVDGQIINNATTTTPTIGLGGYYYLTVTNNYNGCTAIDSVFISEDLTANVSILSSNSPVDTIIGEPVLPVNFSWVGDPGTVEWTLGDNNYSTDSAFTHNYTLRGNYTAYIKLTDNEGCIAYDTVYVQIGARDIIFPNVFTPNGDGINDIFSFRGEKIKTFECFIYNRWGQIIYQWDAPVGGWDGRSISGKKHPNGTYYYTLKAIDNDDSEIEKQGSFMLMR